MGYGWRREMLKAVIEGVLVLIVVMSLALGGLAVVFSLYAEEVRESIQLSSKYPDKIQIGSAFR